MRHLLFPAAFTLVTFVCSLNGYTFTSNDGVQFDGEILLVNSTAVEVRRDSDGAEFKVAKSRFSDADQKHFEEWVRKNPKQHLQGGGVSRISLRCTTYRTESDTLIRKTGRTLIDIDVTNFITVNYDWITVETRIGVTAREETEEIDLKGRIIHVEASSVSGPVATRIYTVFFEKAGGERRIFKLNKRDVLVKLGEGDFYASCPPVEDYYGYGTMAFNLTTGKLMGVAGSNHTIEEILRDLVDN